MTLDPLRRLYRRLFKRAAPEPRVGMPGLLRVAPRPSQVTFHGAMKPGPCPVFEPAPGHEPPPVQPAPPPARPDLENALLYMMLYSNSRTPPVGTPPATSQSTVDEVAVEVTECRRTDYAEPVAREEYSPPPAPAPEPSYFTETAPADPPAPSDPPSSSDSGSNW